MARKIREEGTSWCCGGHSPMADFVQASHTLAVPTRGKGFVDITEALCRWLNSLAAEDGLLTAFICHTSASLTVQENADPKVRVDLLAALEAFAPADRAYAHAEEGPDDMPSHIKSMLTSVSLSIPVKEGRLMLGPWQGVYVIEHRTEPHERTVALNFIGHSAEA
jgi:secondary thiamine-phosphate synthase enzyme